MNEISSGSGRAAAKSLTNTLSKALQGSDKLISGSHPHAQHTRQKETRDAFELSPSRSPKSRCDADEEECEENSSESCFAKLAQQFPLDGHPTCTPSTDPKTSSDPLFLLTWSWKLCTAEASVSHQFLARLKRHAGYGEPDAIVTCQKIHELVQGFESSILQWNVLNGVGPLDENAIVMSIRETLEEEGLWSSRIGAVWSCALVHLHK